MHTYLYYTFGCHSHTARGHTGAEPAIGKIAESMYDFMAINRQSVEKRNGEHYVPNVSETIVH